MQALKKKTVMKLNLEKRVQVYSSSRPSAETRMAFPRSGFKLAVSLAGVCAERTRPGRLKHSGVNHEMIFRMKYR